MNTIIRRTAGALIPAAPAPAPAGPSRLTTLRWCAALWFATTAIVVAALAGWGWLA